VGRLLDASLIVYVVTTVHILHVHTHATMQEQRSPPWITIGQTMKQWRNVQISLARGHQNQPLMFSMQQIETQLQTMRSVLSNHRQYSVLEN